MFFLLNFISHSPHSLDILWFFTGVVHLFPQMPDVHHDCVVIAAVVFFSPYVVKQPVRTYDLAPVFAEAPENGEFRGSQGQRLFIQRAGVIPPVDHQAGDGDAVLILLLGRSVVFGKTAELGLDPGNQLQSCLLYTSRCV